MWLPQSWVNPSKSSRHKNLLPDEILRASPLGLVFSSLKTKWHPSSFLGMGATSPLLDVSRWLSRYSPLKWSTTSPPPLIVPPSTLHNNNKIERAFLWSGSDKTTRVKCKVNWGLVCRPFERGGLGVPNTTKFARPPKVVMRKTLISYAPTPSSP